MHTKIRTHTHTHTISLLKNFKMVAGISFTRRLQAFPTERRINLPEDSGMADVGALRQNPKFVEKNHFWTPAAKSNRIITNHERDENKPFSHPKVFGFGEGGLFSFK